MFVDGPQFGMQYDSAIVVKRTQSETSASWSREATTLRCNQFAGDIVHLLYVNLESQMRHRGRDVPASEFCSSLKPVRLEVANSDLCADFELAMDWLVRDMQLCKVKIRDVAVSSTLNVRHCAAIQKPIHFCALCLLCRSLSAATDCARPELLKDFWTFSHSLRRRWLQATKPVTRRITTKGNTTSKCSNFSSRWLVSQHCSLRTRSQWRQKRPL